MSLHFHIFNSNFITQPFDPIYSGCYFNLSNIYREYIQFLTIFFIHVYYCKFHPYIFFSVRNHGIMRES